MRSSASHMRCCPAATAALPSSGPSSAITRKLLLFSDLAALRCKEDLIHTQFLQLCRSFHFPVANLQQTIQCTAVQLDTTHLRPDAARISMQMVTQFAFSAFFFVFCRGNSCRRLRIYGFCFVAARSSKSKTLACTLAFATPDALSAAREKSTSAPTWGGGGGGGLVQQIDGFKNSYCQIHESQQ